MTRDDVDLFGPDGDGAPRGLVASPSFLDRFSGGATALDGRAVGNLIEAALLAEGSTIEACSVHRAIYLPADDRCNIEYALRIRNAAGATFGRTVIGRLFSSRSPCEAYLQDRLTPLAPKLAGRAELARFARPVAILAPLDLAVSVFPIDGDLPELLAATDPRGMAQALRERLGLGPEELAGCRVEIVQYHRRRRCVLRYGLEGSRARGREAEATTLYGKLHQEPCNPVAAEAMVQLRTGCEERGAYDFRVPHPLGHLLGSRLALLQAIPGRRRIGHWVRRRLRKPGADSAALERGLDVSARIAAALHGSGVRLGPAHSFADELAQLEVEIANVAPDSPSLDRRLRSWHGQLAARAESFEEMPLGFSHGDYSHSQLLFKGEVGGLVDFDDVCQAEPARDLGQFLSYLRLVARKVDVGAASSLIEGLRQRLLGSYLDADRSDLKEEQLRARVALYEASTLLHLSVASWLKFKHERLRHALASLEGLEILAEGRG